MPLQTKCAPAYSATNPLICIGGIDQPLLFLTPQLTTMTCGNPDEQGGFPAPNTLYALIPNFDRYNLAEYLRLGSLAACLQNDIVDAYDDCRVDPATSEEYCDHYVKNKATVTVYFNNSSLTSHSFTDLGWTWYPAYDPAKNWAEGLNYRAQFELASVAEAPSPALAAQRAQLLITTTTQLETKLNDL